MRTRDSPFTLLSMRMSRVYCNLVIVHDSRVGDVPRAEQWTKPSLTFVTQLQTFVSNRAKSIPTKQTILSTAKSHNL
jgi:hypothetical protein